MGIIKRFFRLEPRRWMGAEQIKTQTRGIINMAKGFFIGKKAQHNETFAEALVRLNLSENDLQQRAREFRFLLRFFLALTLIVLAYFLYLLWRHAWLAATGTTGILLILLGQMFRYHFWLFQIEQRKLGCSFREWLASFGGKK